LIFQSTIDNPDLFAFSHSYGTDYANYLVKDKTLLQHLVHSNMTEQIQQGIESSPYLGVTVASAIKQSDLSTIKHLLSHDIHLLKNHYDGYTIIQMAVMQDDISIETIEALIELDSSSCSILARSGESVFKIACESGRDDIIEVLAQHIDISQEINQLSTDISANVKAEIAERNDDYTLTQLLKGEWEVQETDYEIAQLKSVYNSCRNEYSAFYKEEDVLSEIEIREARELIEKLESLTAQDRTKLLFKVFSDESQTTICNIIKSVGIDIDLLAYMACEFNQTSILEYALDKGASLDNFFVSDATTIETILKSDNPEHIELMLSHSNGFICTIINAAEHSRLDLLSKIYQLDKTAFTNNDRIIGYTPIHFLLLGNHISAFEHVISIAPECLDAKTLKGESLLKVGLRSASDEILPLLISKYNNIGDQIKSFIASDEDALAIKLVDHIKLNIETVADNILFAVEKGRDDLARELLLFGNLNEEEIIHYIEGLKDNEPAQRLINDVIGINTLAHVDTGSLADEFALIELEGQADNFLWEYSG
jgi:hypothetical protein